MKVFKVLQKDLNKYFVLKLVNTEIFLASSNYNLKIDHINVVKCFSKSNVIFNKQKYLMYVLEYVNGGVFNQFIPEILKNPQPFLKSILEGIDYLHSNNIVHGDIKPANILISIVEGKLIPKLCDYDSKLTNSKNTILTPEYSPPEWEKGLKKQTDLWSFGCLLHELFTGKLPFGSIREGFEIETILANVKSKPLGSLFFEVDEPFRFIIYKSLIKKKERRFLNTEEILALLKFSQQHLFKKFYYYRKYLLAVYKGEIDFTKKENC